MKGRQFDYPFGVNLSYTPRADANISFAELRALADALPLLRLVIETRKDQIAGLNYTVRARDPKRTETMFRPVCVFGLMTPWGSWWKCIRCNRAIRTARRRLRMCGR